MGAFSNEASATPGVTLLPAPTGLKAIAGNTQVSLLWNTVNGATSYNLYRGIGGGGQSIYQIGLASASFTDTGLTNGTSYTYYVTAVNTNGQGSASSVVTATPGSTPPSPPVLTATAGTNSISLNWSSSSGATSYNVYRSTVSGGEGSVPFTTGITSRNYTDSAVSDGFTYYYTVTAVNNVGEGSPSNEASATADYAGLTAPTLKGIAGNGSAALYWSAVPGATSYTLLRAVNGTGVSQYVVGITGTSYTDTAVVNDTYYYTYEVQAVDTAGAGAASNLAYVTPSANAPASTTIPAVSLAGSGGKYVSLLWNCVDPGTSYNLYRSTVSGGEGNAPYMTGFTTTNNNISYTDTAVVLGTTYYYQVAAVDNSGEGALSNEIAVQPPNAIADFILGPSPLVITIPRGTTGAVQYGTVILSGFDNPITPAVTGLPAGVTESLFPSILTLGSENANGAQGAIGNLYLCVSPTATPGSYYVYLTGTSGSDSHTMVVHLIIT